ncbi:Gfo/Idh/MocA family oxidoreductase [Microbacterium terrae]|nr:dehydrogenase [Microbacterium terrae]
MRVGVVGTGMISDTFLRNTQGLFSNLELVAVSARDADRIAAKAAQFGIAGHTLEQMLDDRSIDLILNLTPVEAHAEVIERALHAGKHVFSEKTLTADHTSARRLADLAEARGLRLGCAPDTFLGAGVQTAAEAIAEGLIGQPTGFTVMLNRGLDLLYEFLPFLLRPGAGMGYDFGVYALTAVLSILGPVAEVSGFVQTNRPLRHSILDRGDTAPTEYEIRNENIMSAVLRLESGVLGTVMFNGDAVFPEHHYLCIQGTEGLILLPNPNEFGGEVKVVRGLTHPRQLAGATAAEETLPVHHGYRDESRGLGAAEMAAAIHEDRPHRASAELSCHIIDVLDGVVASSASGRHQTITSTFTVPDRLRGDERF